MVVDAKLLGQLAQGSVVHGVEGLWSQVGTSELVHWFVEVGRLGKGGEKFERYPDVGEGADGESGSGSELTFFVFIVLIFWCAHSHVRSFSCVGGIVGI